MRRPRNLVRRGGWYYCRVHLGGKLYRRALGTRDMETARDRLAEMLDTIEQEIRFASMPKATTVSEFATRWMVEWVEQRRNPKGVKLTRQRWTQHIEPVIGGIDLVSLTYTNLRTLRSRLDGKLKPQSVHHILSDVRCLLRYAVDAGEIVKAPWRRDLMPRITERAPRRLTDEQLDRILQFARPKESLCVRLAVHTGLRWGELRTLQWRHVVDEPRPHLVLEGTKSGRVRRVPLSTAALEAIEGLRKISNSVFVSPYRAVNACFLFHRVKDRMPEDNRVIWHWHQLRHTFACRYLERGGSLAALQRILGHSTSRMTERYAGLSDAALFADLDRVENGAASAQRRRTRRDRATHVAPVRKIAVAGAADVPRRPAGHRGPNGGRPLGRVTNNDAQIAPLPRSAPQAGPGAGPIGLLQDSTAHRVNT